jgi:hypothetical protein
MQPTNDHQREIVRIVDSIAQWRMANPIPKLGV